MKNIDTITLTVLLLADSLVILFLYFYLGGYSDRFNGYQAVAALSLVSIFLGIFLRKKFIGHLLLYLPLVFFALAFLKAAGFLSAA